MVDNNKNAKSQVAAFSNLVRNGTYSEKFQHATPAKAFFQKVMTEVLQKLKTAGKTDLKIMDCGCGNGAWLDYLTELDEGAMIGSIYGFDLTPDMVEVARLKLEGNGLKPRLTLTTGDILDPASYSAGLGSQPGYDLIFTYDVIQQLPRNKQYNACELIISQLAPGGIAVIFDNDADSPFGKKMARKKFITRYFHIPLVPRYYCNAKYPPLKEFADDLAKSDALDVKIEVSENQMKRALILSRLNYSSIHNAKNS